MVHFSLKLKEPVPKPVTKQKQTLKNWDQKLYEIWQQKIKASSRLYDDMVEEYDVEAEDPPSLSEEELEEARKEMRRQITEAFRPGWEVNDE
jgi:hypothetical protein